MNPLGNHEKAIGSLTTQNTGLELKWVKQTHWSLWSLNFYLNLRGEIVVNVFEWIRKRWWQNIWGRGEELEGDKRVKKKTFQGEGFPSGTRGHSCQRWLKGFEGINRQNQTQKYYQIIWFVKSRIVSQAKE